METDGLRIPGIQATARLRNLRVSSVLSSIRLYAYANVIKERAEYVRALVAFDRLSGQVRQLAHGWTPTVRPAHLPPKNLYLPGTAGRNRVPRAGLHLITRRDNGT